MEWICSGSGPWHGGPATVSGHLRGFQVWVSLPPQLELTEPREQFLLPDIRDEIARGRPIKFEDYMAHVKADHTPVEDVGPGTACRMRVRLGPNCEEPNPSHHVRLGVDSGSADGASRVYESTS
jgi:redox-sensitive bicupin YhaK (pirin superfamily)